MKYRFALTLLLVFCLLKASVFAEESLEELRSLAEDGYVPAQVLLGMRYSDGDGVPQNYSEAAKWFRKAAEAGNREAQHNLGISYAEGEGVPQNHREAAKWFLMAAWQGYRSSQSILGFMYASGEGVPQNYKLAYVWTSLAASAGDEAARSNRDTIAKKLTPELLANAQELAAKFQDKITHSSELPKSDSSTPSNSTLYEPKIKGFGTGFFISKKGHILTCYHVVEDSDRIEVKVGDALHSAKVIRKDSINDLAVLKIAGSFPSLAFSGKQIAKMGQEAFTIGYPNPVLQGVNAKLTKGSVSSLTGFQDDLRLYQISIPVQPGNSGAPLLDMNGDVIGIIVAMLDAKTAFRMSGSIPQNVNYAVKSTYARALLDSLPEVGGSLLSAHAERPFDSVVERVKKCIVMVLTYE
jgi:S1-C subfamily serine protease